MLEIMFYCRDAQYIGTILVICSDCLFISISVDIEYLFLHALFHIFTNFYIFFFHTVHYKVHLLVEFKCFTF